MALKHAEEIETDGAKVQLQAMLKAIDVSNQQGAPICQDTGTPTFYVQIGTSFPGFDTIHELEPSLREADTTSNECHTSASQHRAPHLRFESRRQHRFSYSADCLVDQ